MYWSSDLILTSDCCLLVLERLSCLSFFLKLLRRSDCSFSSTTFCKSSTSETHLSLLRLEKEFSLSKPKQYIYSLHFHTENKLTVQELESMSLEDLFDHEEALYAHSMMKEAVQRDAEKESQLKSGK